MNHSELHGDVGVQLALEVLVLLVVQTLVVLAGFLQALGVGLAEDVVRQHALAEACVARQGIAQLHVLLALLLDHLGVHPFGVLLGQALPELLVLGEGELVDLGSWVLNGGLNGEASTYLTTILVLATPTMSAAVLCSLSEGGMWLVVCEVTYLCLASKSCPFT